MHRVHIGAHRCERWNIPALKITIPAVSIEHARRQAVAEAHRRAAVPPWKPLTAISLPRATAERVEMEEWEEPLRPDTQGELFVRRV
jgi:hypothetical protein